MANILSGKEVARAIDEESLLLKGDKKVTLALFKVGNKDNDSSYERGILKKCEKLGIEVREFNFEPDVASEVFYNTLDKVNNDENVDAILIFRPLPFGERDINKYLSIKKDVDACLDLSLASCFLDNDEAFKPCTAESVMRILKYYNIELSGKKVVVLGRSSVIGKPVSMMLLKENATVTIVHSKSLDVEKICREADILICATGKMESVTKDYVNSKQTIIDVGLNYNEVKHKLCGDVLFDEVEPLVKNITPVPGGVGALTTSILLNHVVKTIK